MVDGSGVWVIDPEFAMYGPMAFDVGKLLANLLLMLFATHGHERASAARAQLYVEQRGVRGVRACARVWVAGPRVLRTRVLQGLRVSARQPWPTPCCCCWCCLGMLRRMRACTCLVRLYCPLPSSGWLSQCTVETWVGFEHKFLALWDKHAAQAGPANTACPGVLAGKAAVQVG